MARPSAYDKDNWKHILNVHNRAILDGNYLKCTLFFTVSLAFYTHMMYMVVVVVVVVWRTPWRALFRLLMRLNRPNTRKTQDLTVFIIIFFLPTMPILIGFRDGKYVVFQIWVGNSIPMSVFSWKSLARVQFHSSNIYI